jgi:hypothetical protein
MFHWFYSYLDIEFYYLFIILNKLIFNHKALLLIFLKSKKIFLSN